MLKIPFVIPILSPKHLLNSLGVLICALLISSTAVASSYKKGGKVPDFGTNVTIFDDSWTTQDIQDKFDEIHALQVDNEMGSERYSLLFKPGTYGTDTEPLQVQVGYYTEVAGLGASPSDVQINGTIEVYNRCFDDPTNPEFIGCFALNNFWRTLSNLTININTAGQGPCESSANMWAVSQAVSMRRVDVKGGNLTLMDYCSAPSFASGGYIADSRVADMATPGQSLINGSQQQWFTRNSEVSIWTNSVWNQVFSGVIGAPDDSGYPVDGQRYTTIAQTPVSREKPYLFVNDKNKYSVHVPSADRNTRGISWGNGMTAGRTLSIKHFFVARPNDSARVINYHLNRGKHLILTPGTYRLKRTINIRRSNTVVLGMGQATLLPITGRIAMEVADRPGIIIAGVTIDAGPVESPVLLKVGKTKRHKGHRGYGHHGRKHHHWHKNHWKHRRNKHYDPSNPITLSDVYFRVGGPYIGKTDIALQVNSDGVLIDHTWVWRADHGIEGFDPTDGTFGDNARWTANIGRNGVVVNGDDVTATGLFVEHFQEYNTIWNGENGQVLLYQCELPYDPPTQLDWTTPEGTLGWAGYKVADDVIFHDLRGGGVYVFNRNDPSIVTENGYEVPNTPGVVLTHVMTKNLSGPGTINSVVNGIGEAVNGDASDGIPFPSMVPNEEPSYVISYPNLIPFP